METAEDRLLKMFEQAKDRERFAELAIKVFQQFLDDNTIPKVS